MNGRWLAAILLVAATAPAARSDDVVPDPDAENPDDETDHEPAHVSSALLESGAVLTVSAALYFSMWKDNQIDFDLHWDGPSWKAKLNLSAVKLDTNTFAVNAVHHPLQSVVQYEIGRFNHFGMLGSELLATLYGVFWEYFIEYREYPSLNDMIVNASTGLEIGEPLWQIAQLWRSARPRGWHSIELSAGVVERFEQDQHRGLGMVSADVDIVADRHYLLPAAYSRAIQPGTWSRLRGRLDFGADTTGGESGLARTELETRTAIVGHYSQDDSGRGLFAAVGTAFTYRREHTADAWDHVAIAHILGPQLQLSSRTSSLAVRWDISAYGDFSMIDPLVFEPAPPFVPAPPYISALQAHGYYYGVGFTGNTRLRIDSARWSFDAELAHHGVWQIDGPDRKDSTSATATIAPHSAALLNAHGISDTRTYARAELRYHPGRLGIAAFAEAEHRTGEWTTLHADATATAIGLLGHVDL